MKLKSLMTILIVAVCFLFVSLIFAQPAFTDAQKAAMGPIIHDYIVQHPQVLVDASQALQKQQMDQMSKAGAKLAAKYTDQIFRDKNDIVLGNLNGSVTMVMFFDYQCVICRAMSKTIETLIKNNPDLRVVYKDFPVHGANSILAAHAAYAASKQGKYEDFHNAIMDSQTPVSKKTVDQFVKQAGLNKKRYQADMKKESKKIDAMIQKNVQLAQQLQLLGTPTFIIAKTDADGSSTIKLIPGRTSLDQLQKDIDAVK